MRGGLSRAPFLFSVAGEARPNARGRSPPLLSPAGRSGLASYPQANLCRA
mgnify:FL=1